MKEKIYNSIFLNQEYAKEDLKNYKLNYPFKYKFDYLSIIFLSIIIISFVISLWVPLIWILGVVLVFILLVFRYRYLTKRKISFLYHLRDTIKLDGNKKYNNPIIISELFPIYLLCDDKLKTFNIIYHDNDIVYCDYNEILKYKLLIDKIEIRDDRLKIPNKDTQLYFIEIIFKNKKKAQIGFSNIITDYIVNGGYKSSIEANVKSINMIAKILDNIIKHNKSF